MHQTQRRRRRRLPLRILGGCRSGRAEVGHRPDGALAEREELQLGQPQVPGDGLEGVDGVAAEEELPEVVVAEGGLGVAVGVAQVVGALWKRRML